MTALPTTARTFRPTTLLGTFFLPALILLAAAAVLGVLNGVWGIGWGRWPVLHLALLGGVSQLVLGAAQFFVAAFLATDPPPRRLVIAQAIAWNAGALAVVASRPAGLPELAEAGTVALLAGLGLFVAGILLMRRSSLQKFEWAIRWYVASAVFLIPGLAVGAAMSSGLAWSHGSLLGTHLALNLLGWFGTAIVGTLHTLFPSLSGTRLRHPRLEAPTFALWVAGVTAVAAGQAFALDAVAAAGWLALIAASTLLAVNLVGSLRAAGRPLSLPLRLVATGQLFLPAGFMTAFAATLADGAGGPLSGRFGEVMPVLVVAGWIGLTVAGSLLHLVAMLARIRSGFSFNMPAPSPSRDIALASAAGAGIALMALASAFDLASLQTAGRVLTLAALLLVAGRLTRLATVAFRPGTVSRPGQPTAL